jgi:hypothetical protein
MDPLSFSSFPYVSSWSDQPTDREVIFKEMYPPGYRSRKGTGGFSSNISKTEGSPKLTPHGCRNTFRGVGSDYRVNRNKRGRSTLKRQPDPFTIVGNAIIEDERITKHALLVYMILCKHADRNGENCFPSLTTIAKEARAGKSSAIDAIKELIQYGYLTKTRRKDPKNEKRYTSNIYTITALYKLHKPEVGGRIQDGGGTESKQEQYSFNKQHCCRG